MDISMDISREYQKQKRCPMQPKFRQNPRLRMCLTVLKLVCNRFHYRTRFTLPAIDFIVENQSAKLCTMHQIPWVSVSSGSSANFLLTPSARYCAVPSMPNRELSMRRCLNLGSPGANPAYCM